MANVSRPVNLYSATDYAVLGLEQQKKSKEIKEPKKPKKVTKKATKPVKKNPPKKIKEVNRKKLLPWM